MWFEFNQEEIEFREELCEFLDRELPDGWIGPNDESSDDGWALYLRMRRGACRTRMADDDLAKRVRRARSVADD